MVGEGLDFGAVADNLTENGARLFTNGVIECFTLRAGHDDSDDINQPTNAANVVVVAGIHLK